MPNQEKKTHKGLSDLETPNFDSLIVLNDAFSNIKFFEKEHKYTIDNEPAKGSVSGLIKNYEPGFDSSGVAANIARRSHRSTDEVLEEWDFKRDYSCHKGSEFHLFVENFLERKKISIDKDALVAFMTNRVYASNDNFVNNYYEEMAKLICNFLNFYEWWKEDHILIKSEFVIGDKESGICGTVDNLSYNKKTKEFAIFDYKTNKEIKKDNSRGERMLSPFNHLYKCELSKYSLQLALYSLIFEKNTPFKIGYSGIVWVSGENDYELIKPLDLRKEAELLLNNINVI